MLTLAACTCTLVGCDSTQPLAAPCTTGLRGFYLMGGTKVDDNCGSIGIHPPLGVTVSPEGIFYPACPSSTQANIDYRPDCCASSTQRDCVVGLSGCVAGACTWNAVIPIAALEDGGFNPDSGYATATGMFTETCGVTATTTCSETYVTGLFRFPDGGK
jgi:hypothetical protein